MSKFGESGQIMFSLKVSKNYFSQVYGHNFGQNVINGVNLVKIGHFCENAQNSDFLGAKLTPYVKIWGKWSNNFFSKSFKILFQSSLWTYIWSKNVINGD